MNIIDFELRNSLITLAITVVADLFVSGNAVGLMRQKIYGYCIPRAQWLFHNSKIVKYEKI